MTGLLRKEIYVMAGQTRTWFTMLLFMVFYGVFAGSISFLYMIVAIVGISGSLAAFSYDQACQWDAYCQGLPVSRREVVKSRYLFSVSVTSLFTIICLPCALIVNRLTHEMGSIEIVVSFAGILLVILIMLSILLPVVYKMGVEKARYIYMAVFAAFFGLVFLAARVWDEAAKSGKSGSAARIGSMLGSLLEENPLAAFLVFAVLTAAGMYVSFRLSVAVYEKKDF